MRVAPWLLVVLLAACGGSAKAPVATPTVIPLVTAAPTPVSPPKVPLDPRGNGSDDGEIVSARGHLDPAAVQAGVAPHATALQACYNDAVGRRRWLGGKVTLKWQLSAAGVVTQVQIADSDLGAWPIEQCLLNIARKMQFAVPTGGDKDFSLPLEFVTKGGNAQWWDEDRALAAVGKRPASLATCDATTKRHGGGVPPSDVTVTLYVGPHGAVQSVGFASAGEHGIADSWAECASAKVWQWALLDPKGKIVKMSFRFRAPT